MTCESRMSVRKYDERELHGYEYECEYACI